MVRRRVRCVPRRPRSPWPAPFPPPPPPPLGYTRPRRARSCSVASQVLRSSTTPHVVRLGRAASAFPERPGPRSAGRASVGPPGSRARRFRACLGSPTARGPRAARAHAANGVAFRPSQRRRHPGSAGFRGSIARLHVPLTNASPIPSRVPGAWLGVAVDRYSFGVGLFHPLLRAGLSRRLLRSPALGTYRPARNVPTAGLRTYSCRPAAGRRSRGGSTGCRP